MTEFAKHTEVISLLSILASVLELGAVVQLTWPWVSVCPEVTNSSVSVCSAVLVSNLSVSVCSVATKPEVCMVVYSTVAKSVVYALVCSAVTNVHSVGSVIGGDSAWQNSVPTATPAE